MAWSGGTFTRVGGATHWVDDKNAAIPIIASRHDTNDEDLATGINFCLTRDNQAKPTGSFLPNADNSIDLGALATRWRALYAVTAFAGDGSSGSPAITFAADTNTGDYRNGPDSEVRVVGGVSAMQWILTGGVTAQVGVGNGTVSAPSLSFFNDFDNGAYLIGANDYGFSTGGTLALEVFGAATPQVGFASGTMANPSITFVGDTDSGDYRNGPNSLVRVVGAASAMQWILSGAVVQVGGPDGTAAQPGLSFFNDYDTGIFRSVANRVSFACGGADTASVDSNRFGSAVPFQAFDGAVGGPAFAFLNDTTTGFYRTTASQIAISLGGTTAGQIAQGSFTGTLTGFTANPTGTVFYQRIGNVVTLWIQANITGTSNATTMTMTGLPAIIQPASLIGTATQITVTDNSTGAQALVTVTGGTMTFSKATGTFPNSPFSSSGFTAAGTKGLSQGFMLTYPITT